MPQLRGRRLSPATGRHPRSAHRPAIPDAPRSGKVAGSRVQRSGTPPPRRRSPRLGGPLALPAAAAPLTCIDAMMKPSPQGQRGPRRRGRSRRARVTPRGPNIPGTGAWSPMGRGPRVRLATVGARGRGGAWQSVWGGAGRAPWVPCILASLLAGPPSSASPGAIRFGPYAEVTNLSGSAGIWRGGNLISFL